MVPESLEQVINDSGPHMSNMISEFPLSSKGR